MKWAGYAARMGRRGIHIGFLVENPEEKRPLGRLRRKLEDNIKMILEK
jgi:superfamily II DNA/RNA helicase